MIGNVIEKSKLGAMEDSAYGLIDAANYYYAEHMNEMSSNKLFVIENGAQTSEEKLNYKGKVDNAIISINKNGKTSLCIDNGEIKITKGYNDTRIGKSINGICSISDIGSTNNNSSSNEEIDDVTVINSIIGDINDLETSSLTIVGAINEVNNSLSSVNSLLYKGNFDFGELTLPSTDYDYIELVVVGNYCTTILSKGETGYFMYPTYYLNNARRYSKKLALSEDGSKLTVFKTQYWQQGDSNLTEENSALQVGKIIGHKYTNNYTS